MKKTSHNYDRAFEKLLEARKETDANDIAIAEHEKEINKLKNKKIEDERKEHVLAANYFTPEKIRELHEKTIRLLKCDDFNQDDYVLIFSNSTSIERKDIEFLMNRQEELYEMEKKLDNTKLNTKEEKLNGFWLTLAEILHGGNDNDA